MLHIGPTNKLMFLSIKTHTQEKNERSGKGFESGKLKLSKKEAWP